MIFPLPTLDPDLEDAFRRSRDDEESRRVTILAAVVGATALVFAAADVRFGGSTLQLYGLFGLRALFAALSVVTVLVARSDRDHRTRDRVVLLWALVFVVLDLMAASTRPEGYVGYVALTPLIVLALYTVVPGPSRPIVGLAVAESVGVVVIMVMSSIDASTTFTIIAALLATHAIGLAAMWNLRRSTRDGFLALRAEQQAKARLEAALEEIRTLHGILPICASCKKIQSDTGAWEPMEVYVSQRSDAQFSHGLCPACLAEFYGHI